MEINLKKTVIFLLFAIIFSSCSMMYIQKTASRSISSETKKEMILNHKRMQKRKRKYKKSMIRNKIRINNLQKRYDGRKYK